MSCTRTSVALLLLAAATLMCGPGAAHPHQSPPPPDFDQEDPLPPPAHHHGHHNASAPPRRSSPPPPDEDHRVHSRRLLADCADAPAVVTPIVPGYGGGYAPVGAPYQGVAPPASSPAPSPGGPSDSLPAGAPQPVSGDDGNSTLAHTTVVSAMKFNQCTYTIVTSTGNIEGASTHADVNVEFFDKLGESVLFVNLRNQNRNFNRGATDTFTVVGECVHDICKMHLSHDDSGPNPGWFVNTVSVSLMYQTHVFNVFEWLSKDEPPYSLSRTITSCPA